MTTKITIIGLNYLFIIILNSFLYLLFFHDLVLTDSFSIEYSISIIIQFILSIILVYFDTKIKRGIEK